ncbi:(2Fe-2S)-binding protein [Comamonadaceae bacterium G21597-S1]|nr:(2Fe-2S)-binding protein [Comamonadaceae bacterium G21597-S1]
MSDNTLPGEGVSEYPLHLTVNGMERRTTVPVACTAADLLRDDMRLTGTRVGCSRGVCGACVALVDGVPAATCSMFAFQLEGCDVQTIEGLEQDGQLHLVQQAFVDQGAFQCGYCTSGMVLLTKALLERHPRPDRATIAEWISSNVCRCTGYAQIIAAVEQAAARLAGEEGA